MTTTPTTPPTAQAAEQAAPYGEHQGLPIYRAGSAPDGLCTATQLREQRLKLADGQEPKAYLYLMLKHRRVPLYDPGEAVPMRPLSAKQQAAWTARRTCPQCTRVSENVVYGGRCQACREEAEAARRDLEDRTCWRCKRVSAAPLPRDEDGRCLPCHIHATLRRQAEAAWREKWARTCPGPGCEVVTATDEEITAARAAARGWSPRWCPPCKEQHEQERARLEQEARECAARVREARERAVRELQAWAAAALADENTVILDTETTGLDDEACIVDLAITTTRGEVLLNTLINPGIPIPASATAIHGVDDEMVADAPTFSQILDQLRQTLAGRRCLIYNQPYDVARLRWELTRYHQAAGHQDPAAAAGTWLAAVTFEDVMIPFSDWVGEEDDYHGGYRWQPLGGDHRALGDCRAVVDVLRSMARQGALV